MTMLKFLPLEAVKIHERQRPNGIENDRGHFYHPLPLFRLASFLLFFGANIVRDRTRKETGA